MSSPVDESLELGVGDGFPVDLAAADPPVRGVGGRVELSDVLPRHDLPVDRPLSSLTHAATVETTRDSEPVLAISQARNNAELIEQCRDLGYLTDDMVTLDPTWGLGRFWTNWQPSWLVACDLDPAKSPLGAPVDFTDMAEFCDDTYNAVVFDPPYKLNGTGGSHASDAGYGVANSVRWQDRHQLIRDGITECVRVLQPRGTLLVKCQDQVCSGQVRWQTREFADHAESLGCRLVDALHLVGMRPQPPGRRQVHARRNYSTLLVLKKEARRG